VCHVVHRAEAAPKHENRGRIIVDAEILRQLVVGTLNERAVDPEHRFRPAFCKRRSHSHSLLLRDSHVDKLLSRALASVFSETEHRRSAGRNAHHRPVGLHQRQQMLRSQRVIALVASRLFQFSGRDVERHAPMETFLLALGKPIPFAFKRVYVEHDGMVDVAHTTESLDHRLDVVAVSHIEIVEAHSLEEVARRLAVGFAQQLQVAVKTAVVFVNRHLVVVDHHNHV